MIHLKWFTVFYVRGFHFWSIYFKYICLFKGDIAIFFGYSPESTWIISTFIYMNSFATKKTKSKYIFICNFFFFSIFGVLQNLYKQLDKNLRLMFIGFKCPIDRFVYDFYSNGNACKHENIIIKVHHMLYRKDGHNNRWSIAFVNIIYMDLFFPLVLSILQGLVVGPGSATEHWP